MFSAKTTTAEELREDLARNNQKRTKIASQTTKAKQNKTMATMKEKPHYNKTHYCRCKIKTMAIVYRDMTQEKKDIVEEMGFGALAHVLEMNVSHALLRELIDHFAEEKGCLKTL
ncbi:uncharacterized protein LOC130967991 [Arachis stenosperma]|uniref:uncharacterized protein LOC130967991 n=1 Tax=Arachis stenosperma TaxID=217475 RepID=UPI0025AD61E7|nr:uncharacterized protein LOC130967991 [Arachis stenosperma]